MASTEDTFRFAIRGALGPAWDIWSVIDGFKIGHSGNSRLLPFNLDRHTRTSPAAVWELTQKAVAEMMAELDPKMQHRERRYQEATKRIEALEAELAGAKAIIADLFRQARDAKD